MPNVLRLNTVQGIGDIFWVYQKVAPYVNHLDLNILCTDDTNTIQRRSTEFCAMLPKVRRVTFVKCKSIDYHRVASTRYQIGAITRAQEKATVEYAVNKPLEEGINLRDIDLGSQLEVFVDLRDTPLDVTREDYLCVFVAGAKTGTVWPWQKWVPVVRQLASRLHTNNVTLIGASWDNQVQDPLGAALTGRGLSVQNCVGNTGLAATIDIIRRARFFLGYQSGLNVLAENYDVSQLMVYFDKLRPMMYTWCKPESVRTRFHAFTFADNADAQIDALPI